MSLLKKGRLLCGVVIALGAFVHTAVLGAQAPNSRSRNETIKVDVNLVLVNASVSDYLGRIVTGLHQENFQLWEDKVEQEVVYFSSEETPASVGLIFDGTGSMLHKIARARDAAVTFLKGGNREDEYFLV